MGGLGMLLVRDGLLRGGSFKQQEFMTDGIGTTK